MVMDKGRLHDSVATGLGGVVPVVVTCVIISGKWAATTECGITGGIRANIGRAFLKVSSVVVEVCYAISDVVWPFGSLSFDVLLADTFVTAVGKDKSAGLSCSEKHVVSVVEHGRVSYFGEVIPAGILIELVSCAIGLDGMVEIAWVVYYSTVIGLMFRVLLAFGS